MKHTFFLSLLISFFTTSIYSQKNYNDYNTIGIYGGLSFYDIKTGDLNTGRGDSYLFGFQLRGNFYNDFDLIYGIGFSDATIFVSGRSTPLAASEDIKYNLQAAQVSVLGAYNIIGRYLSIEAGPVLNINGRLNLKDDRYENYIIDGYTTVRAEDIQDVSKVNLHLSVGLSGGHKNFKAFASYQYGLTNILGTLNDKNLEYSDFKGNASLLNLGIAFYF